MTFANRFRVSVFFLAAGAALAGATAPVSAANIAEPLPTVTPIPITDQSYPWLSYKYTQRPLNLDKAGYVEEEYLVSGKANVYDWNPDPTKDLLIKNTNAPYATRILVRRPKDPAKFSGTVVVEAMNPARGFDMAIMFGWIADRILERGDVWIGVSVPGVQDSLKRFDASRYSKVSWANPLPENQRACPAAPAGAGRGGRGGAPSANANENGLRLDALAQIGKWLKSNDASNPVARQVKYVFLTGHTASDIGAYISSVARQARLDNGKPIYDGFLTHSGSTAGSLMNCGSSLPAGDTRSVPGQGTGVPMVIMKTESDIPFEGRPDSDTPNDILRVYEMPASSHADKYLFTYLPQVPQQAKASDRTPVTDEWPFDKTCDVPDMQMNNYPQGYLIDGALENLERYARDKTPLPKASRVGLIGSGASAKFQLDQYGNPVGGVRLPYIDVPIATYHNKLTGAEPTCVRMGYVETWPWQKTMAVYGTYDNYVQKVNAAIQKAVADRWVTPSDAARMRKDMLGN